MRVLILGAGGHAQVIADILFRMRDDGAAVSPVGYVDDDPSLSGQERLGLPVFGPVMDRSNIEYDALIVGIGSNTIRCRLFTMMKAHGERFATAIHPAATIARGIQIGAGTVVCAGVVVNVCSTVGENVILNTACTVDHHNRIGNHAHIAPGVHLGGDVTIGTGSLIGIGATVMPQRRVGDWSVVSAGGLIHRDLPDRVVAAGNPARVVRDIETEM
jgi:sugar O-acyltransferase (sialic acid O-acetyltransferase NeuD family)